MTVFTCLHSAGSVLGGTSWLSFQDERLKSRQTLACDPIQCLKTQYECHLIHACVIVCVLVGGVGITSVEFGLYVGIVTFDT